MSQSLAKMHVKIVFSTKNRMPLIGDSVRTRLHGYVAEVLMNAKCPALAINSMDDHLHVLCDLHRMMTLSNLVGLMKSNSSRWMKEQGHALFSWQSGFGAFAVSAGDVALVIAYIERQREHHSKLSFQDEMRDFFRRNQVEWNEEYAWD